MSEHESSPRKPRRRLAITVRLMMLLILIVAAGLGMAVRRAQAQRRAVVQIKQAGGDVLYDYAYSLAGSSWAPAWLRGLEVASVNYYLPTGATAQGQLAHGGESVLIRSFQFPGANPNTIPPITMSLNVGMSSSEGLKPPVLLPFEQIDTLTINEIESARFTASFFDEESAPATAALLLELAPIKSDEAVQVAKLKTDLLTERRGGPKPNSPRGDARSLWKRLERRDSYTSPWEPAWLQRLIGDEYGQEVTSVNFHETITDNQSAPLENFSRLAELTFHDAEKITDSGLARLSGLTQLRRLDLRNARHVTDAGMPHLAKMVELRELTLDSPAITDVGFAQIGKLSHLEKLTLGNVTDAGLAHVNSLSTLRELNLMNTDISDAGLARLKDLKNLHSLSLACNRQITNAGLAHLAFLSELRELDLSYCHKITDTGLHHLRGLYKLRKLNLDETWVSDTEVAAARAATPGLVISRRGRPMF